MNSRHMRRFFLAMVFLEMHEIESHFPSVFRTAQYAKHFAFQAHMPIAGGILQVIVLRIPDKRQNPQKN